MLAFSQNTESAVTVSNSIFGTYTTLLKPKAAACSYREDNSRVAIPSVRTGFQVNTVCRVMDDYLFDIVVDASRVCEIDNDSIGLGLKSK